jgi:4-hydroxy-2-oxoheptanedioate aldolase
MKNLLKEKMSEQKKCIGTFSVLGSTTAIEALSYTGLDFLLVDTEHGPFDPLAVQEFFRVANIKGITPCVRIKDSTRESVLRMLDIGAEAIIVPCIESVEEARRLVEYAKYYPLGRRGVALGRVAGFGYDTVVTDNTLQEYFNICNRETLLIPQCETKGCLSHIEEIVQMPGIDGIFVGPYDLSVALEDPGVFDTDEFKTAIKTIIKATKAAGKFLFIYSGTQEQTKAYFDEGFDAIAFSTDVKLLIEGIRQILKQF